MPSRVGKILQRLSPRPVGVARERDADGVVRRELVEPLGIFQFAADRPRENLAGGGALGAVLGEVERGVLEDADEVGEALNLLLALTKLSWIIEIGHV